MTSDWLILLVGIACLAVGAAIGYAGTYYWLLTNIGSDEAENHGDFY